MTDWAFDVWPSVEPQWHDGAQRTDPWDTMEFHVDLGMGTLKKGRIGIDRYPAPGVNVVMDLDSAAVFAAAPEPGLDAAQRQEPAGWRYHTPPIQRVPLGELPPRGDHLDYPGGVAPGALHGYHRRHGMYEPCRIGWGLPFEDSSIESIISHHALEHIGEGFLPLVDDIYRVLKPGGIFRAITPLFPSSSAVADADHCRYFMEDTWEAFCGTPGDTPTNCWLASFSVPYTRARFEMLEKDMTSRVPPEKHWTQEDAREIRVTLRAMK